jgi:hypothetical protein
MAMAVVAMFCATAFAGNPSKAERAKEGFEKLKSLVGTWKGTSPMGEVTLTYKLVSNGSTIMEVNDSKEHKDGMISMYHLDGNKIAMTHYCSMGNQPKMSCAGLKGNELDFNFVSISNLSSPKAGHMRKLKMTFKDDDHMIQQWTLRTEGKDGEPMTLDIERQKQ